MNNGIIYIAYGKRSRELVEKNLKRLKNLRVNLPVAIVGDEPIKDTMFLELKANPWNFEETNKYMVFYAGEIKPHLAAISPFTNTLYLDADTIVYKDPTWGFDYLKNFNFCVSYHLKKNRTPWYVHEIFSTGSSKPVATTSILERDFTYSMLGRKEVPFLNSGVFFFNNSERTMELFANWYKEWQKYKSWDEQMALHRAIYSTNGISVKWLNPKWNQKYPATNTIIHHEMGMKKARHI